MSVAQLFTRRMVVAQRRSVPLQPSIAKSKKSTLKCILKARCRSFSSSSNDIGENGTPNKTIWDLAKEEEEEDRKRGMHRATTDDDESKISAEAKQLNEQGQLYFSNGLWEEALECFSTALQALETVLGSDHVECSTLHVNIGLVYEKSGDQTNAELHYQKALNIRREALGENHVSVASVLHKLTSALISKGDYDDALAILQQSQDILSQTIAVEKQVLARARDERSIAECQQRISMLDAELGQMFNFRGAIFWKRQNWASAEENFMNSYQHFAKSSEFQQDAVAAMKKQGKMDQAIKAVSDSVKVIETRTDAALPELINLLCLLGELHEMMGAFDLAEFHYGRAIHIARDVFGKVSDEVDDLEHSIKHVKRLRREEDEYRRK